MGFKISNISTNVNRLTFKVKKHSPMLMTIGGMAGLVGTTVLAYKSGKKVVEITEDIEAMRANGDEVDKKFQIIRVGKAVLPPVLLGTASLGMIFGSYHVLTKRNGILATAVTYLTSENERIKKKLIESGMSELTAPVDVVDTVKDEETGDDIQVVEKINIKQLDSVWYDESEYYVVDDHSYNETMIREAEKRISARQLRQGHILLNEVLHELGIAPMSIGTAFGWSDTDLLILEQKVFRERDEELNINRPTILITWPTPKPLLSSIDYSEQAYI